MSKKEHYLNTLFFSIWTSSERQKGTWWLLLSVHIKATHIHWCNFQCFCCVHYSFLWKKVDPVSVVSEHFKLWKKSFSGRNGEMCRTVFWLRAYWMHSPFYLHHHNHNIFYTERALVCTHEKLYLKDGHNNCDFIIHWFVCSPHLDKRVQWSNCIEWTNYSHKMCVFLINDKQC